MKFGIYTNREKDTDFALTKSLAEHLMQGGAEVSLCSVVPGMSGSSSFSLSDMPKFDCLVIFGGDGTLLSAAPYAAQNQVPMLGINLGYLGFLTEVESCNASMDDIATRLISKDYSTEERSMLCVKHGGKVFSALNDIVLQRDFTLCTPKKTVTFTAFSAGMQVGHYNADGLIVSTPTGSTAYSLSAGGPILSPELPALVITAICPHSLSSRPIVIGDSDGVEIEVGSGGTVNIITDGYNRFCLAEGQRLHIHKADYCAKFIRFNSANFYSRLKTKLNMWSVT